MRVGSAVIVRESQAARTVVELVAHRGESADAPENTRAAFNLAWERGIQTIELDAHLTRDGALIVCHDADTARTTGTARTIKESSYEDLRHLDAGCWKGPRWAGETLPLLGDVLEAIPEGRRCLIEIKVGPEAVPALVDAVQRSGRRREQLTVMSFHAETVAEARRQMPELTAYDLAGFQRDETTGTWHPTLDELIARARATGSNGLGLSAAGPIDRDFVRAVKSAGLDLYVWTVDDPIEARRLAETGIDGMMTNKAAWMKRELRRTNLMHHGRNRASAV